MKNARCPHRARALKEFGDTSKISLKRARMANFAETYGMGTRKLGQVLGHYPPRGTAS